MNFIDRLFGRTHPRKRRPYLHYSGNGFITGTSNNKGSKIITRCRDCDGKGWSADWGGPYICPNCRGTGDTES